MSCGNPECNNGRVCVSSDLYEGNEWQDCPVCRPPLEPLLDDWRHLVVEEWLERGSEPAVEAVVYWTRYKVWVRYEVFVGVGDVLRWRYIVGSMTKEPHKGEVHVTVSGPSELHSGTAVTEEQAGELTGFVGPPALDRLRELVEG